MVIPGWKGVGERRCRLLALVRHHDDFTGRARSGCRPPLAGVQYGGGDEKEWDLLCHITTGRIPVGVPALDLDLDLGQPFSACKLSPVVNDETREGAGVWMGD